MAYDDALFQLGMDLTRSSTAQKEDHGSSADVAHRIGNDYFIGRDGVRFAGTHLVIDLVGARRLDDLKHIERTLKRVLEVAGATPLHMHLHQIAPNSGVSGMAVLADGHISIHSCPGTGIAAVDVLVAGQSDPTWIVGVLRDAFEAARVSVRQHDRGRAEIVLDTAVRKRATVRQLRPRVRKAA
jgi:S-adenosylmethionine decarboxylase